MKNKSLLSIEKNIIKWEKTLFIQNYYFKSNFLESSFGKKYIRAKCQDVFWGSNLLQENDLKQKNTSKSWSKQKN